MCTTRTPKPAQPSNPNKPIKYMSNPWLDGLGVVGAGQSGRNSLRIDPGTPRVPVTTSPPPWMTDGNGGLSGFGGPGTWFPQGGISGASGATSAAAASTAADRLMNSDNRSARFMGLMAKGLGVGTGS